MRRSLFVVVLMLLGITAVADKTSDYSKIKGVLSHNGLQISENTDTVVTFKGYPIRIIQENDSILHAGLNLFSSEVKEMIDEELLGFIERDLLLQVISSPGESQSFVEFKIGNLTDMKRIDCSTPFNISNMEGNLLSVEWRPQEGKTVLVYAPISYEILRGMTRGEVEQDFISRLKKSNLRRNVSTEFDPSALQRYGDREYFLPGSHYINENITGNIYLYSDGAPSLIWDVEHPSESISNLFISSVGKEDSELDLTVIKHEYGEKEEIKTTVENFMAVAANEGCIPFWGIESLNDGKLTGSLFLYNEREGYDHVLKIECLPEEIIEGRGSISANAYLYIPSNNVRTINEPYRIKSEDEKIRYWED